ncbi:hypothetical protein [Solicola sp. PLA-1-18]|uniref:hypothetical protein n=1 Tax=Solicola sp. PLA-1-18 TaxID=3380532 RepID=UPI003B7DD4A1
MTATISDDVERQIWSSMPGWGIAADLTPREVVERRRVRALRKLAVAGLALVLLLCVAGFAVASLKARSAADELETAQAETTSLLAQQGQYRDVVKVQADTRALDAQIAQLMTTDVDAAQLLTRLRTALPGSMSLTSMNISLTSAAGGAAPGAAAAPAGAAPDAAGVTDSIGTATLAGTSQQLSDLATYVTRLEKLDGVADVLPATNAAGEAGNATWSVTLSLTKDLHTHRYDQTKQADGGSQ